MSKNVVANVVEGSAVNNAVNITGEVVSEFELSHEVFGEKFYCSEIAVTRLSGNIDTLKIMASERIVDITKNYCGKVIQVVGQFRSYNYYDGTRSHLVLFVLVNKLCNIDNLDTRQKSNEIHLDGYVCKKPIYRKTSMVESGREITDILLAVNRPYGKSDYIPCIAWGKTAREAKELNVGDRISLYGRIQSREYSKKLSETESEKRIAYEVSIVNIELNVGDRISRN